MQNSSLKNILQKLPLTLIYLLTIAFCIKGLREPDLWWQIRTGQWILEHKQIPTHDVFSYTYAGSDWVNVKWGFEVIAAWINNVAGAEAIFLLQAVVACFIVFFLLRLYNQLAVGNGQLANIAVILSLIFTLLASEYRFNGRPEMFSHLFTVIFLWILLKYRKEPSNKIFWLVPLQVVWANMHEAFGIGLVLVLLFAVGAWAEFLWTKRGKPKVAPALPKQISLLLLLVVASVVINPRGYESLLRPFNILGQVYQNKYTLELADFRSPEYWGWNVYWCTGILVVGVLGTLIHYRQLKTKENRFALFVSEFGPGYLLTLGAFLYLALTAQRNVIFLALVFFPVLVTGMQALLDKVSAIQKFSAALKIGVCSLIIILYCLVVSNKYYQLTASHDQFGLGVLVDYNPVHAADAVQQHKLKGKCFSDYLTSSYLLYKLQPDFKTFIDLRDLDVFPDTFFNTFATAVTFPSQFEKLDSIHHFDYLVLYRPQFEKLHNYLFNKSNFKLVFANAVAVVYTRKTSPADSSIFTFLTASSAQPESFITGINYLFNPFSKEGNNAPADYNYEAAGFALSLDQINESEAYLKKSEERNTYKGKELQGRIFYERSFTAENENQQQQMLNAAGMYFNQSLAENPDYSPAYMGLGTIYFKQQNIGLALEQFEKAAKLDKQNVNAWLSVAECSKIFINNNSPETTVYINKAITAYSKANALNPDNPKILLNLGFLHYKLGDCKSTVKYLTPVARFEGLQPQERDRVRECLKQCGE